MTRFVAGAAAVVATTWVVAAVPAPVGVVLVSALIYVPVKVATLRWRSTKGPLQ